MKNLADVPQLKQLDLTDTAVTLIDDLELVPNLTNLDLTGCDKIEDFGVLAKLPNLKRLDLDATRVTNKVIEIIANLDDLEELHIQRMDTFSNIQPIENLVKLRILKLSGTAVRDLKPIEDLSELRVLYLPGALKTNPAVLDQLKEMKKRNSRLEWRFGS